MPGLLLNTYLVTEMLAPFFASLVIINSILFLGRLMQFLEAIFDFGITFEDFIRLSSYLAPTLLLFSTPMASMIGVIIAFSRMRTDHEILAFKAAGIGLYRMLPAVLILALATTALSGLASAKLIPAGNVAMKRMLFQLAKEKIDRGMREKQFMDDIKGMVLYVDRINQEENTWEGVYISDMRNQGRPVTITARHGKLNARIQDMNITLDLADGTINRVDGATTQTILFQRYLLTLPLKNPAAIAGDDISQVDKQGMLLSQLAAGAKKAGITTFAGKNLLIEYHKRLVLPIGCFILTIIGLPLALLRSGPGRGAPSLLIALSFFLVYYILFTTAKNFAYSSAVPVGLVLWIPNIIFAVLAILLLRGVARETPGWFVRVFLAALQKISNRWPRRPEVS
ncbi:MAG: hypothetical protein A2511_01705 [Deltaproteobacteria bacterium RIFOXYD12_FULL_50_9]|nr:MAG: hypothetical protein A2511_01705 [Deltaproteobacteria bacterium RIFOXYD12_FULL_50_9]